MSPEQLIEDNIRFVYFILHTYYPNLVKDEDIIQVGMLGLCNAANSFDESKSKFSSYASFCIRNEINQELRRRKKHYNTLSLDYEYSDEWGESSTFGDLQIGESDVPFVDVDGFYNLLDPVEKEIYRLRQNGDSVVSVAETLGCSREAIYQRIRQMKAKWRTVNGD